MNVRFAEAYGPKYEWDMEGFSNLFTRFGRA